MHGREHVILLLQGSCRAEPNILPQSGLISLSLSDPNPDLGDDGAGYVWIGSIYRLFQVSSDINNSPLACTAQSLNHLSLYTHHPHTSPSVIKLNPDVYI